MLAEKTSKGRKRGNGDGRSGRRSDNESGQLGVGICKNACYCLTSLAACIEGNLWLARNNILLYGSPEEEWTLETAKLAGQIGQKPFVEIIGMLNSLLLLVKSSDEEVVWFTVVCVKLLVFKLR